MPKRLAADTDAEEGRDFIRTAHTGLCTDAKRQDIEKFQIETWKAGFLGTAMEPVLAFHENPLKLWARNAHKYLLIARVARNTVAVPVSPDPTVGMVSHIGLVITQCRNRLKPERLEHSCSSRVLRRRLTNLLNPHSITKTQTKLLS